MSKRIAIIDIGTNTVNLLIVDRQTDDYDIIYTERVGVGLGHGGINNSFLEKNAVGRGIKCLKQYAKTCKTYQTESIFAFGTSALRHASNAHDFVKSAKKETGIDIQILDGQEEANLCHQARSAGGHLDQAVQKERQ